MKIFPLVNSYWGIFKNSRHGADKQRKHDNGEKLCPFFIMKLFRRKAMPLEINFEHILKQIRRKRKILWGQIDSRVQNIMLFTAFEIERDNIYGSS